MQNIVDYIKENKDVLFSEREFNNLDAVILARLSYINYEKVLKSTKYNSKRKLIDVINDLFVEKQNGDYRFRLKEDKLLLEIIRSSLRYKDFYIKSFIYDTDISQVKQFSAITFVNEQKNNRFMYVSFKGTDGTVTGWKEDFTMAYLEVIPAQVAAMKYLRTQTRFSTIKRIYVGGHSKGGNLAIYAASNLRKNVQNNIKQIYSFDGPGFKKDFLETPGFKNIKDKILLFTPTSSIIGRLLYKDYKTIIVNSKKTLLYQHNIYNWGIEKGNFEEEYKYSLISNKIDIALKDNLDKLTYEEKKEFVDELFEVVKELSKDDVINFGDSMIDFFKRFAKVLKTKSKTTQDILKSIFVKIKEEPEIKHVEPLKNDSPKFQKIKTIFSNLKLNKQKKLDVIDYTENIDDIDENYLLIENLDEIND